MQARNSIRQEFQYREDESNASNVKTAGDGFLIIFINEIAFIHKMFTFCDQLKLKTYHFEFLQMPIETKIANFSRNEWIARTNHKMPETQLV
jgi:hypothetical protein